MTLLLRLLLSCALMITTVGACAPVVQPTPAPSAPNLTDECTADPRVIARTEFVIERYFQLASGGSVAAITDCFAQVWRARPDFVGAARTWSGAGPAMGVGIEKVDSVNGCERVRGSASMRGAAQPSTWYFNIGPESGRTRIYAVQTALVAAQAETTRCN